MSEKERFFGEIKLDDAAAGSPGNTSWTEVMKVGVYRWYDDPLKVTTEMFETMKRNFDNKVKKIDLAVDYFHENFRFAAGWIKQVEIRDGGQSLWIQVEWTEKALAHIKAKEIKYMSIEFDHNYVPNDSQTEYGFTINGAGVTNRPFIKGMTSLFSEKLDQALDELDISEEKRESISRILNDKPSRGKKIMELTELKKECAVLSDDAKAEIRKIIGPDASVVKMAEENTTLKAENEKLKAENTKLSEGAKTHAEELKKKDLEAKFTVMLSEGKAVEAQREPWMAQDIQKFTELAQTVNLDEKGNGGKPADPNAKKPKTFAEAQDKIIELAEEKRKADPKLSLDDAQAAVLSDPANKEIVELYEKG